MKTYHNTKDIIRYVATRVTNCVCWRMGEYNWSLKMSIFNLSLMFQCSFYTWETERASLAVCTEVWERSTIMPSLFISCTTVCNWNISIPSLSSILSIFWYWSLYLIYFTFPKSVSPLCWGTAPGLSALEQSALKVELLGATRRHVRTRKGETESQKKFYVSFPGRK